VKKTNGKIKSDLSAIMGPVDNLIVDKLTISGDCTDVVIGYNGSGPGRNENYITLNISNIGFVANLNGLFK
jgi:hypothetical protein